MFSELNHLLIMYTEEKTKNLLLTLKPLKRCDLLNYYELNLLNFVNHAVSMLSKIKKRTRRRALCFASSNSYNRVIYILILTDIIQQYLDIIIGKCLPLTNIGPRFRVVPSSTSSFRPLLTSASQRHLSYSFPPG